LSEEANKLQELVEEVSRVSAKEFSRVKARVFVEQELSEMENDPYDSEKISKELEKAELILGEVMGRLRLQMDEVAAQVEKAK